METTLIQKNTKFQKGQIPHNKGISWSKEVRQKISKSKLGRKISKRKFHTLTDKHKKNLSLVRKGKGKSKEWSKKIGDAQRGEKNHRFGKKNSIESRIKQSVKMSGEKSPLWKGGVSKINRSERENFMSSIEYHLWHEACFARDNWTCQKTGIHGGKLVVHHMYNYADYPELRTSIENGITLSIESHKLFHKMYGVRNNTREQLVDFLNNKNI